VSEAHDYAKRLLETVAKMKGIKLNENQMNELSNQAMLIRGLVMPDIPTISNAITESNLTALRAEDSENTLWNVLNRLQEKAINGGLIAFNINGNRVRNSRGIRSIDRNLTVNRKLFDAALTYLEAV
jgi:hypothetical protein